MNKFWIVFWQTYSSKVKAKSFMIVTLVAVGAILLMTNINQIMDSFASDSDQNKIAVVDRTNEVFDLFNTQLLAMEEEDFTLVRAESEEGLKEQTLAGDYSAYITISYDENQLPQATYYAPTIVEGSISGAIEGALQQVKGQIAASQLNLTQEELMTLSSAVGFEKVALEENAKSEEELSSARGIVYVLLFVIYFAVIMYSAMIGSEVAIEKSSRVMEILISSISPVQQMFAKILGVALVSLTQLGIIIGVGYYSIKQNLQSLDSGFFEFFGFSNIQTSIIVYAIVFTLLGYFLYATLSAFLGSIVSRIEDLNQTLMPVQLLVMVGFFIAMYGLGNPDTVFITVTSYIPFFTPVLMFMRVSMLEVPVWEVALSIGIMLAAILLLAWFGAKVYRGGVLMYGAKNSIKEIKKALQLSKNN
ncbi:ABC-2 type transport system permease protein [Bacillus oleivorans]|uniref:ABC-2 type transport system permease protein n=1 Tax=Bacillus oleivorans TaxID=1448271 RepID=A0A285CR49_9BACI|nr:ABC transporter permease [Bacillus oleivorans]SNX70001.1 ABC-2 type transport system permease protein [Bacillus oleivorans]